MCLHVFCDLFGVVCVTDFVLCVLCVLSCWAISVDLLVVPDGNSMCHAADRTMTSHYPYTLAHVRKYTLINNLQRSVPTFHTCSPRVTAGPQR